MSLDEAIRLLPKEPKKSEEIALGILKEDPNSWKAWVVLGKSYAWQKNWEKAEECYRSGLEVCDENEGLCNLYVSYGEIFEIHGDFEQAFKFYQEARKLSPNSMIITGALANIMKHTGDFKTAEKLYKNILKHHPKHPETSFNLSTLYLAQGRWKEGWPLYKARWGIEKFILAPKPETEAPLWEGQAGTLLIWGDQGLGDIIWGLRYAKKLMKDRKDLKVILHVPSPVYELIKYNFPECTVIKRQIFRRKDGSNWMDLKDDPIPPHDYQIPLLDLPDKDYCSYVRLKAPNPLPRINPPMRIGIVWQGNSDFYYNPCRSTFLEDWEDVLKFDATFVSLQFAQEPPKGILDVREQITDFAGYANVIESLDLVIGVDTGVMHLAASLGKPTWWLIGPAIDWRWTSGYAWYPQMRGWRLSKGVVNDRPWREVLNRVAEELWSIGARNSTSTSAQDSVQPASVT